MWFASRGGYVGAFHEEAFNAPLLLQVAEELRGRLVAILGSLQLKYVWAFKYSNRPEDWPLDEGVSVHADDAAVNVNLWLSPRAEGSSGGLTLFTKQAPAHWESARFNYPEAASDILAFLDHPPESGRIEVPYEQNRAVIFNSNLFHASQPPRFPPGYTNRRINLTFLFGDRAVCARTRSPDVDPSPN